jgi:thiol:disulfide interchange protein DsbD
VLFTVLAFNLFGAFELMVPPALIERAQAGAQAGRFFGPLAMGLTFTLTSFTCTVPFVGTLLATTTKGDIVWPVVGMLAFSTAFALPFFLLALFPQWLARLPKSGGWLVTVKAFMGFVELAAALKFLSSAELQWKLGLLTRPVFLALWFAIALVAACYMLGLLRFPHDGTGRIGPARAAIGVLTLAAGLWVLTGMNGRPLGALSAFLPPLVYPGQAGTAASGASGSGVRWVDDYDSAVQQARAEHKLLFLNFTGINCGNCRVMEDNVLVHPDVTPSLKQFVAVELYTDKENDARSKQYQELEQKLFGQVSTPLYAVITPDGQKLGVTAYGNEYISRPARFAEFLAASKSRQATLAAAR